MRSSAVAFAWPATQQGRSRTGWIHERAGQNRLGVPRSGPVQLKSCCAKRPGSGFDWPSAHERSLVRRTQLTGSLAGSPDCQIYLSFSGHAAKKAKTVIPTRVGSQLTDANFKGVSVPDG